MNTARHSTAPNADKAALARVGTSVRRRLAAEPAMHRVDVDKAEIFAMGQFLSAEECTRLRGMIDQVAKPSPTYDPESEARYRTSYSGDVDSADSFVRMIERRICDLLGLDLSWGETVQGQRYLEGQEFKLHCDWFPTDSEFWANESRQGGQRSWTAMAFLNAVDKGGETHFVNVGVKIEPKPGVLLVWNNALADGSPNEDTLHAGTPVIEGVKYVLTKWYRTRKWK